MFDLFSYKSFQKTMKYNELKVTNDAQLWSYWTIKKIKDCVAHIDDDLLNKKENPSECYDFKSNERKGSTTVNTMLIIDRFIFGIWFTEQHYTYFRILSYWPTPYEVLRQCLNSGSL